jgi:predicted small lipoprotein YifL
MGRSYRSLSFAARRALALLVMLTVLAACGRPAEVPDQSSSQRPTSTMPVPTPEDAASAAGGLKEAGEGLYLKEKLPPAGMEFIDHVVITGDWSEFESTDQEFSGPGWDRLAEMMENPQIKVRLRIQAGKGSPSFVKKLGGPPASGDGVDCSEEGGIAIAKRANTADGVALAESEGCVPYFWTDPVLKQYEELMEEVARRYESHPRLLDVVDSACTTFFAEPFIRAGRSRTTNARLFEAGLNQKTDEACLRRSVEIHDRVFPTTRVSLATHSAWQIVTDPEKARAGITSSWDLQRSLLEDLRRRYGAKLVVQNNGLGGDEGCGRGDGRDSHFCWLAEAAPPKGFQTEGGNRLSTRGQTVLDAVRRAVDMGACFVEHNEFGDDPEEAEDYDRRLKDNC